MLNSDQAIEAAKKELVKNGHAENEYSATVETYKPDDKKWIVWFEKIGPFKVPGGKHAVLVHKTTGETVFLAGE